MKMNRQTKHVLTIKFEMQTVIGTIACFIFMVELYYFDVTGCETFYYNSSYLC